MQSFRTSNSIRVRARAAYHYGPIGAHLRLPRDVRRHERIRRSDAEGESEDCRKDGKAGGPKKSALKNAGALARERAERMPATPRRRRSGGARGPRRTELHDDLRISIIDPPQPRSSPSEINDTIKRLKRNKASGPDEIAMAFSKN